MSTTINKIKDLNGNDVISKYAERDSKGRKISQEIDSLKTKIYGVRFYGSSTTGTRMYNAIGMTANVGYGTETPINDFDYAEIFKDIVDVTLEARDSNGNILKDSNNNTIYNKFVKIPNFYFKYNKGTDNTGSYVEFIVGNYQFNGSVKIFGDKECALVGKYYTTPLTSASGTWYGCEKGQHPKVSVSQYGINNQMAYVSVNNTLVQPNSSLNFKIHCAISYLFMIEFATRNCQSIMQGIDNDSLNVSATSYAGGVNRNKTTNVLVVKKTENCLKENNSVGSKFSVSPNSGQWQTLTITNIEDYSEDTTYYSITFDKSISTGTYTILGRNIGGQVGTTDDVLASSGIIGTRASTIPVSQRHFKYRGLEDAYANLWSICSDYAIKINVEGGVITSRHLLSRGENGSKTDPSGWNEDTTFNWSNNEGFVKNVAVNSEGVMITEEAGGSTSTYYCDYYYRDNPTSTSFRGILVGGNANNGAGDGLLDLACNSSFGSYSYSCALRPQILL